MSTAVNCIATLRYPSRMVRALTASQPGISEQLVIVGTAGDRRVSGFQDALARAGRPASTLLDYRDLVAAPARAAASLAAASVVRIDSPGRDPQVLSGLLALGLEPCAEAGGVVLARDEIADAVADRGRLLPPMQIFCGLMAVLDVVQQSTSARFVPDTGTIALAFDKTRCRDNLAAHAISVPPALPDVVSFDSLVARMMQQRMPRAFLKLRHGSAASGAVALAISAQGVRAISTVELVRTGAGVRLYNTRAVRTYVAPVEVAELVDALVPYGLHCEAWVPKAGVSGRVADLRVLTVAGDPVLRVVRKSVHPMTNLHLGGERGDADAFLAQMSPEGRAAIDATCRDVARAMPGALQLGIDVAVAAGFKRHYVLEVNAFGDLLGGVTRDGRDAYDLQLAAMEEAA